MDETQAGWYPDPTGRHERRYWTGLRWSRHVEDRGVRSVNSLGSVSAVDSVGPGMSSARGSVLGVFGVVGPSGVHGPADSPHPRPPAGRRGAQRRPYVVVGAVAASLAVGLGAAVALGAGGSGNGDDDEGTTTSLSQRDQYVRHISAYVYEVGGVGTIGPGESDCVAEHIVDGVGVDRLEELDVLHTLEDPTQPPLVVGDGAQATYAEAFACLDDGDLVTFLAGTIQRSGDDVGPDQSHCMVQGWLDGMGRDALIAMYTVLSTEGVSGDSLNSLPPDRRDLLIDVAQSCITPPPITP